MTNLEKLTKAIDDYVLVFEDGFRELNLALTDLKVALDLFKEGLSEEDIDKELDWDSNQDKKLEESPTNEEDLEKENIK